MKICVNAAPLADHQNTCIIMGIYEDGTQTPQFKFLNERFKGQLTTHLTHTFEGKLGQVYPLFSLEQAAFGQILLIGCGKSTAMTPARYKKIMLTAVKALLSYKIKEAVCYLSELEVPGFDLAWKIKQLTEATQEGLYQFDLYKSNKENPPALALMSLYVPDVNLLPSLRLMIQQGEAVADGVTLAKNLANLPSNICTPTYLAEQALALRDAYPALKVEILEEADMRALKMGALLAVSQGSAQDAKLISIAYQGGNADQKPYVLVGKGVTFDTGGNSIKPADSMVGMKYDMCGAATVLGVLKTVAELKLPINVVGVIPTAENMPGGNAYKPEDILVSMSGQTIEVISTDAEGRLLLADALTYCEKYNPEVVIDIATLTGAVVIALGFHVTGLISNNEALAEELMQAGIKSNDRCWELPMLEEFQEQIKSPFADMANTGGRSAGTITAGCFLSRFAQKYRWAHLDVAGTAAIMAGTHERLATGRPVPMLVQYLLSHVDTHA